MRSSRLFGAGGMGEVFPRTGRRCPQTSRWWKRSDTSIFMGGAACPIMVLMTKRKKPAHPMRLERCPEYDNPRALLEHEVAVMLRVSRSGDLAMALRARQLLVMYGERLLKGKRQVKEEAASTVLRDGSPHRRVC